MGIRTAFLGFLLLIIAAAEGRAQELYAVGFFSEQQQVVRVDIVTGAISPVMNLGTRGMSLVAADPVRQRLFLVAFFGYGDLRLFIADLKSGTLVETPFRAANPMGYAYDFYSDTLFGVGTFSGTRQVVEIDITTGTVSPLLALAPQDMSLVAFDPLTQRVFLQAFFDYGDLRLFVGDLAKGTLVETPFRIENPVRYTYDASSRALLGIGTFSGQQQVVKIDLEAGTTSPLVKLENSITSLVLDSASQRLFLEAFFDYGDLRMFVADLRTASIQETAFRTNNPRTYAIMHAPAPVPALSAIAMAVFAASILLVAVRLLR